MRSPFKLSALLLTAAMAFGVAAQANAMDNNEEGTPQEISAKLRAEGQHPLGHADAKGSDNLLHGLIFTSNADGTVGYILQSDQPFGDKANKFKVYRRLTDVQVYDGRNPPELGRVLLKADDSAAIKRCKELEKSGAVLKGECIPFNKTIRADALRNQRVMIQALNVDKTADGSYKPNGVLTTVTGNFSGVAGAANSVSGIYNSDLPSGATLISEVLFYADYEAYALALFNQRDSSKAK